MFRGNFFIKKLINKKQLKNIKFYGNNDYSNYLKNL